MNLALLRALQELTRTKFLAPTVQRCMKPRSAMSSYPQVDKGSGLTSSKNCLLPGCHKLHM